MVIVKGRSDLIGCDKLGYDEDSSNSRLIRNETDRIIERGRKDLSRFHSITKHVIPRKETGRINPPEMYAEWILCVQFSEEEGGVDVWFLTISREKYKYMEVEKNYEIITTLGEKPKERCAHSTT